MNESSIQVIAIIASNLIIMLTFFGVSISMHNRTNETLQAIHEEMKEFHGELKRIDAEFKGKIALQDAEFKAHLMHYHKRKE